MTTEEYIEKRLENQRKYFSKKSTLNKKYYHFCKIAEIVISVSIPFLAGYVKESGDLKYIIGAMGVIIAILAGLEVLLKFHDKWIVYRNASESLKQEKFMFLSKAGSYKNDQSLSNFSERTEMIIASVNSTWNQFMKKNVEEKK
ncbi:MAG: DUF4231 domain-containing protein [Bacteroidales bacterium]|nr:DUF4231 domain-containing protein [Bacteroidales bacterium]